MICKLFDLEGFDGTITTGATAGNILGIACAREEVIYKLLGKRPSLTGEGRVRVLCAGAHSSISKACSILGVGRDNIRSPSCSEHAASFSITCLEKELKSKRENFGSIVIATFGEVNTGGFTRDIEQVSVLCERYNAWLHIDAAFGIMARIHPDLHFLSEGLEHLRRCNRHNLGLSPALSRPPSPVPLPVPPSSPPPSKSTTDLTFRTYINAIRSSG